MNSLVSILGSCHIGATVGTMSSADQGPEQARPRSPSGSSATSFRPADPAVSPDGSTVAFVVSRVDMDKNKTFSQVWLAAADGSTPPRAVTGGDHDSGPAWSPDGRSLAFASKRGAKKGESTLHVLPIATPGETRTIATMKDGVAETSLEPGRAVDRVHQPHPRRALRRRGRELAGAAQDRAVLQQARQRGLDRRSTAATCTSSLPTAPARRAT